MPNNELKADAYSFCHHIGNMMLPTVPPFILELQCQF
jgi:hypothetical protein